MVKHSWLAALVAAVVATFASACGSAPRHQKAPQVAPPPQTTTAVPAAPVLPSPADPVLALLEASQFNAKALATSIVRLEDMLPAYEQVAYRTTVTAIMTP